MELLIVVTLLVILATALLVSLNPFGQINKGRDSKRKSELSSLGKVLEDWYNDKNCYPKAQEICYDTADSNNSCHICGTEPQSPSFSPYLSRLPCDPLHPAKKYLYQTDGGSCPGWYIVYTSLSNNKDPVIAQVGCQNGCGPTDNTIFNYFVSSSNITLESGVGPTSAVASPTPSSAPPDPTATSTPGASPTPTSSVPTATPTPSIFATPTPTPISSGQPCSSYSQVLYVNPFCNDCGVYSECKLTHGPPYFIDASICNVYCIPD